MCTPLLYARVNYIGHCSLKSSWLKVMIKLIIWTNQIAIKKKKKKKNTRWHTSSEETSLEKKIRTDNKLAPSQWEMSFQRNAIYHWLGANLESALYIISKLNTHVLIEKDVKAPDMTLHVCWMEFLHVHICFFERFQYVLVMSQVPSVFKHHCSSCRWSKESKHLTVWSLNNMAVILQTTFSSAFFWKKT